MSSYLRLLKMNVLRSGVYKQIVRHPWMCIACLFACLYAILVLLRYVFHLIIEYIQYYARLFAAFDNNI